MPDKVYQAWVNLDRRVGQAFVHASDAEIRTVMAGRQSGKTMTGVAEICLWAQQAPDQILWWVAPSYKVMDKPWRDIKAHLPANIVKKSPERDNPRFELHNGSTIYIKSADAPDSLVSEKLHGLVGDEAGQWKSTVWYMGLLPMFNTTKMRALFIGTPRGRNWFYDLWMRGRVNGLYSEDPIRVEEVIDGQRVAMTYHSFHWTSYDSPYKSLEVLSEARRTSPQDLFAQEYLAEPIENAQGVFKKVYDRVKGISGPTTINWLGVDLASKHDFSAFALMNANREVFHIERSQEDYPIQKQRIAALALKYNARIVIDATGLGLPVSQDIRAAGFQVEDVTLSNEKKRNVIDQLRVAFEVGAISIPNDADLLDELISYEYAVLPSGALRYSAPEGKHDDQVIAVALANWGARSVPMGYDANKPTIIRYLPRAAGAGAVNL